MNEAIVKTPLDLRNQDSGKIDSNEGIYEKNEGYFNLLAYIFSNAVSGEIMAVENYSEMVMLMSDTEGKIEAVKQSYDESKHIRMLSNLGKRFSLDVMQEIIEPQWFNIRRYFSSAVQKKDLISCLIIQDLLTEGMAIVLYRILQRDTDSETAVTARKILEDEEEHLNLGLNRIRRFVSASPEEAHESLSWSHYRVMPELFSMVSTNCHFLCDRLGLDCSSLSLSNLKTDINSVRLEALELHMEILDRAGFDPKITAPLIAKMQSY